jgi:hypothetical protein
MPLNKTRQEDQIKNFIREAFEAVEAGSRPRLWRFNLEPQLQWYSEFDPLLTWIGKNRYNSHVIDRFESAIGTWVTSCSVSLRQIYCWTLLQRLKHFYAGGSGTESVQPPPLDSHQTRDQLIVPPSTSTSDSRSDLTAYVPKSDKSKMKRMRKTKQASLLRD